MAPRKKVFEQKYLAGRISWGDSIITTLEISGGLNCRTFLFKSRLIDEGFFAEFFGFLVF